MLAAKVSCSPTFEKLLSLSELGKRTEISLIIGSFLLFKQNVKFQISVGMSGHRGKLELVTVWDPVYG